MSHVSTVKNNRIANLARGLAAAALALGLGQAQAQAQAGLIVTDLGAGVTRATIDNLTMNVT